MPLDKSSSTLSSTTTPTSGPPWLLWLLGSAALHGLVYVGMTAVLQDKGGAAVPGQRPDSPFTISMEQRQQVADSQQQHGYNPMQNAGMQPNGQPRLTPQQLAALTPEQRLQYLRSQSMQGAPGTSRRETPTLAQSRLSVAELWKMRDEWGQVLEAQHAQYRKMIGTAQQNPMQRARQAIAKAGPDIAAAQKQQQRAKALMHKLEKTTNPTQKGQLRQELLDTQRKVAATTRKTYQHWQDAASALSLVKDEFKTEYLTADSARYGTLKTAGVQEAAYAEQVMAANMSPESLNKNTNLPQQFKESRTRAFPAQQLKANQTLLDASREMTLLVRQQQTLTQRLKGKTAKTTARPASIPTKAILPGMPPVNSKPGDIKKQNIAQLYNTSKELEEQISRLEHRSRSYAAALRKKIKIEDAIQQNGSAPGAFSRIDQRQNGPSPAELEQRYPREIAQVESRFQRRLEEAQQEYGINPSQAKPLQAYQRVDPNQPNARPQLTAQQQRLAREMLRRQMGFNSNSKPPANTKPPRRTSTGQRPNRLGALPPTFAPPRRSAAEKPPRPWQPGRERIQPISTRPESAPKPGPKPSQPGSSPTGKPGTAAPLKPAANPLLEAINGQRTAMPQREEPSQPGAAQHTNRDTILQGDTALQETVPRSNTQATYGLTEAVEGNETFTPQEPQAESNTSASTPAAAPTPTTEPGQADAGDHGKGQAQGARGNRPPRRPEPGRPVNAGMPRDHRNSNNRPGRPPRDNRRPQMESGNPGELSPEIIEQIRAAAQRGSAAADGRPLSGTFGAGTPTLPPDLAKRMQEARQRQAQTTPPGSASSTPRTTAGSGAAGEAAIPEALRSQPIWSDNVPPPTMPGAGMGGVPGRKILADGVPGADWMFIDSWYTVGPFPNPNRANIHTAFPPEQGINLDAVYTGKNNQSVRWEFVQTGSPFLVPANPQEYAVYYAYTELWFEEAQELTLAVGSDDAGKMWINDKQVWQSSDALKPWRQAEDLVKVQFQKGRNRILYRVENGIILVGMSLTISLKPEGN